jgi:hypothetical protein
MPPGRQQRPLPTPVVAEVVSPVQKLPEQQSPVSPLPWLMEQPLTPLGQQQGPTEKSQIAFAWQLPHVQSQPTVPVPQWHGPHETVWPCTHIPESGPLPQTPGGVCRSPLHDRGEHWSLLS